MGLLDKAKRALRGPMTIDVVAPDTFRWTDDSLPVIATFTNETDAPFAVAEVRFALEATTTQEESGSSMKLKFTLRDPFVLEPGETTERAIAIPLAVDTSAPTMRQAATEAGLPSWVGSAMNGVVGEPPRRMGRHHVSVVVKLDSSSRLSSAKASTTAA